MTRSKRVPTIDDTPLPRDAQDYLAWLRVECGLALHTLTAYETDLRLYCGSLAGREPRHARAEDIADFLGREEQRGTGARSRARRLVSVRGLHRWLSAEKRAPEDPAAEMDAPKIWKTLPAY